MKIKATMELYVDTKSDNSQLHYKIENEDIILIEDNIISDKERINKTVEFFGKTLMPAISAIVLALEKE